MFDANLIIWIVVCLAVCVLSWNAYVLVYAARSRAKHTDLSEKQPLVRWAFSALRTYVCIKVVLIFFLTAVQVTRNYYLAASAGIGVAPDWLFWVVVLQNVIFYGLATIPAVILFAFTWALSAVDKAREDKLNEDTREYLGLERKSLDRLREREEGR